MLQLLSLILAHTQNQRTVSPMKLIWENGSKLERYKHLEVYISEGFMRIFILIVSITIIVLILICLAGAFFERNCVCTELNISIVDKSTGDCVADNDCRSKEVTGTWTNVTGRLINEDLSQPGRWEEVINGNSVNYTVIAIGPDYAVEYDCGESAVATNYCIHVMSRTRTMDQAKFNELINMAEGMGLNPENLPVKMTLQEGC